MNATVLDLRKNMKDVLAALDRNEKVTLTYRGRKKAVIIPCDNDEKQIPVKEHPAFGIWADREDMKDVSKFVRNLRKGRSF
jgi:antitoxin (DNA-binding transcriptional repressor) of toxin-antitoxin stability system